MNRVIISGRIVTDPRTAETRSGSQVFSARIAVPKWYRRNGGNNSDYFTITMFGANAERAIRLGLARGDRISIEGRLQNDNFTSKDGAEVRNDIISVLSWEFAENKRGAQEDVNAAAEEAAEPVEE